MKKNKTLLAVLAMTALGGTGFGVANAQLVLPENRGVTIGTPENVGQGNKLEREITPLMRDIAKKKSEVDIKSLDRELEKMNDDSLKDQISREKMMLELSMLSSGQMPVPRGQGQGSGSGYQMPGMSPGGLPQGNNSGQSAEYEPSVRVLLVYGFEDNLKAKISVGSVGGYVLQKGDILPDGRLLVKVTSSYIEVRNKGSKSTEKISVSGYKTVEKNGGSARASAPPQPTNNLNAFTVPINLPASIPVGQPQ